PDDSGGARSGEAGRRAGAWPEDEEIPDPQSPVTFERSKLTRRRDPTLARLYEELLSIRAELASHPVGEVCFDERQRWLRVRRGRFEIACSFGPEAVRVPAEGHRVRLATHGGALVRDGHVELAPMSGALIE